MTQQDLTRLTDAATRWHRKVSGTDETRSPSLWTLSTMIGKIAPETLSPRLAWEGKHLQVLISRAFSLPPQAS